MKSGRDLCDAAPIVKVPLQFASARPFTLVMPYYENPIFFAKQIENIVKLNSWNYGMMSVIVVDDGSREHPAYDIVRHSSLEFNFSFHLFRIDVDVRWNWLAARNIAAHHTTTDWIMLTDMDHVLPKATFRTLLYGQHDPDTIYRFSRVEHTGEAIHPHPNSWFMTKKMFWKIGGYDERMSGYYGSDGYYRRRCGETAPIAIMAEHLVRHERIGDSSTVRYLRKQPEDAELRKIVRAFPKGSKPLTLSFPYREIVL